MAIRFDNIEAINLLNNQGEQTIALTNDQGIIVSGNVAMATGNATGKFAVMATGVHASYDFYNNGTSYFNGGVVVDAGLSQTGGADVTFTGNVTAPSFTGTSQGAVTGAPDATIWRVSGQYPTWGIFYDEGSPDFIQFKANGTTTATISLDNGDYTGRNATFAGNVTLSSTAPILYLANTTSSTGKTWRFSSAANGNAYITQDGVIDAITLSHTSGNATFAGGITTGGDITLNGFGAGYLKTNVNGVISNTATIPWATVSSTPTTISGYGITDAFDGAYSSLTGTPTLQNYLKGSNSSGTYEGTVTNWNSPTVTGFYSDDGATNKWSGQANWTSIMHVKLYDDNNNYATQIGFNTYDDGLYTRTNNAGTWTSWKEIYHSGVFTNNSSNWNTAYTDRNKWDGGSTGLTASTGRTSLGLGTAATAATGDFATAAQGTTADAALPKAGGTMTGHIAMEQNHLINYRFEMIENASPQYILLCRNAAANDVNGVICMDRSSGNWQAASVEVIVSAGSSAAPKAGALRTLQVEQDTEEYTLVTVTHGSNDWIAIKYTGNTYPETSGAYFTGRLKSTGTFLTVVSTGITNETAWGGSDLSKSYLEVGDFIISGNVTVDGTLSGTNFSGSSSGTNTGDQVLPTASSLGAVTLTGTQTISGAKTFGSTANQFNGHLYYNAYDSQGQHYPHFRDGTANNGADINWRQYYGSSYKTHTWTSDASGNMTFTFQGDIDANGGDITADNFSGSSSGTNTGDQDLSSFITSQRAISSTPTDGATTTAISSDWAFDNVKTAVPANALFTDANTTYSAGTGLDLTGTTFSIEPDLRDGITKIGKDSSNYIAIDADDNNSIDFYVSGVWVARMEADGDLHMKGDVIAFSDIFNP
jgi:hypothetical protein